jgi:hypothetical protein
VVRTSVVTLAYPLAEREEASSTLRVKLASFIFHGRSFGGAQERGLECLIEVTSNLGHTLVAELPEEG